MIYVLVVVNICLLVFGQMLWKTGMMQIPSVTPLSLLQNLFSPYILAGIFIYGFATLLWLYILGKGEFSVVYPLQSLAYALGVIVAFIIFRENIPFTRWVGVVVIIIGAFLVSIKG
jgi:drug/metabolite transporter (DMT)-like permease